MTKDKWHGHIAIFVANILFGINIPIAKTLMPEWIDPVGLTFLRMSFGALALLGGFPIYLKRESK